MKLCIVVFIICASIVYGQWASRVHLEEFNDYFHNVMQETVLQLEQRGFSNLKLDDKTYTISQQMYKWLVEGNVTYTNGFLVSIQKIDVTDVQQQVNSRTVDGVVQSLASVQGFLNFRDMKIGYDVMAELGVDGDHRFTGTFVHSQARFQYYVRIMKNLHTQEITVSHSLQSLNNGQVRMDYLPTNNISQVISRNYVASSIFDRVGGWGRDFIMPIILDVATNKIEYPRVCLDCR